MEIATPLEQFPRLWHATAAQRSKWEIVSDGKRTYWTDLEEYIAIAGLFGLSD